jgi:hypothetical protein
VTQASPPPFRIFIAGYFQRALYKGLGEQEAIAIYKTLQGNDNPT